ncbi:Fimbrillin-A associated anchor protein Mfa1 and Mfa2 [Bacteroides luti]|uniref:Fimbrillin-A associated anchor protein Mfa1 and Mfa2 n=1 Tax=Bacteroides luti TaxID=1297750 RepID=A0A1M4U6P5_9BACE|nr:FimB/Mfa2 family fimbrial subunit [Bacteroides luti]SHE52300.1 Fimbrillin-A associated anchor protein Mfa1 and Mfa2 [Bacteroides luti]
MKYLRIRIITVLCVIGTLLWSCDSLIYSDLKNCPQGVYVKFYSKTPCADDSLFIGSTPSLSVFAFNQEGKLETSVNQQNVNLSRDYEVLVPVSNGNYSFIAWAGINDKFIKKTLTPGVTTKQDLMMVINSNNNIAAKLDSTDKIWNGESPIVYLPDPKEYGSLYEHTAVNLKELTNRVKIIVEFDKTTMKEYDPSKLNVAVYSANGSVRIDGTMPLNNSVLTYPALETKLEDNIGSWYYSMPALKTGYSNILKITYTGKDKEETVFNGDLIASILLRAIDKGVNMDCENDFTVRFLIKDYCAECWTHFSCAVYVNNWLVHSYSSDFEI